MPIDRHVRRTRRSIAALACALTLVANSGAATPVPSQCLTPAAEPALKQLIASSAFRETLGSDRTLKDVRLSGAEIEMVVDDTDGTRYQIRLAAPGASSRAPAGIGRRFVFYLTSSSDQPDADAARALLSAAALADQAIPDSAFAACNTPRDTPMPEQVPQPIFREEYPRALALVSAIVQLLILLTAVVFGRRAIRAR